MANAVNPVEYLLVRVFYKKGSDPYEPVGPEGSDVTPRQLLEERLSMHFSHPQPQNDHYHDDIRVRGSFNYKKFFWMERDGADQEPNEIRILIACHFQRPRTGPNGEQIDDFWENLFGTTDSKWFNIKEAWLYGMNMAHVAAPIDHCKLVRDKAEIDRLLNRDEGIDSACPEYIDFDVKEQQRLQNAQATIANAVDLGGPPFPPVGMRYPDFEVGYTREAEH